MGRSCRVEALEPRSLLSAVAVNTANDVLDGDTSSIANLIANPGADGVISLREAIKAANNTPGLDTITFDIPGAGVHTITPLTGLPRITDPVFIDGTSQPDYLDQPLIELDGHLATNANGLQFTGGGNTVSGLDIHSFAGGDGILLEELGSADPEGDNTILDNYIGTDPTGMVAEGNIERNSPDLFSAGCNQREPPFRKQPIRHLRS